MTGLYKRPQDSLQKIWNRLVHYDYHSPSLTNLPNAFESFFPDVVCKSPYNSLVPHTGRYDRRFPSVGLLTYDEATILYNYGLQFRNGNVVEIGCWVGWSTAAWAMSGAQLVVIDPVLDGMPQGHSCRASLQRANASDKVEFVGEYSHIAMPALAAAGRRASAIFIDGDHEGDAPLRDCVEALNVADDDCVIILHDLVQPNIPPALHWLRQNGWSCGIHYTSQFLGVAWRGRAQPLRFAPDPEVDWQRLIAHHWKHLAAFEPLI